MMKAPFAQGSGLSRSVALALIAVSASLGAAQSGVLSVRDLSELQMGVPDVIYRSTIVGRAAPSQPIHLCLALDLGDKAGLQAYANAVSDPKNPLYRHFLQPQQIATLFGLPYNRVQEIADYMRSYGLKVSRIGTTRTSIILDGTVAQAEAAFHTTINRYRINNVNEWGNANYTSNSTPLKVPASFAPDIVYVEGMETFMKPKPMVALTPTQTRTLYNLAPIYDGGFRGTGRKIAISNWDGYRLSNVPLYYTQFSLPTPPGGVGSNITEVHVGTPSAGPGTPAGEGDLDIQMVLGMAPLCDFMIYDGNTAGNRIEVVTREADDNLADVISESWGWKYGGANPNAGYDANHNQHLIMSAEGITYMAASGDSGTNISGFPYPNFDPEVLMVGGSVANIDGTNHRINEVGWSNGGGGWSTINVTWNVLPPYQVGTGVPTTINFRLSPDVALQAAGWPSNGAAYPFYLNGSLNTGFNGTSFACPVFAGGLGTASEKLISLGGLPPDGSNHRRFGRIQDLIYGQNGRSDVWFDVTSGSNGTLPNGSTSNAGVGWDFVTGWGCINWNAFVDAVKPAAYDVSGSVKQNNVGVPGVVVHFQQNSVDKYTATTDANGNYTAPVANGDYTLVPTHNDKYFFPSTKNVTVNGANLTNQNFTAANNGPVSIQFEYPVVYSDQSRKCTLNLIVTTPVSRDITMSDNTTKLTSPVKVTVPAGQRSANFFVYGVTVTSDVVATITASHQGVVVTGNITVRAKPSLTGITLGGSVKGGVGLTGSVAINKPAVGAMYLVLDTDNHVVATVSPTPTAMPNGATTKSFYCKTYAVGATTNVTVSATFYGSTATKVLQVHP